MQQIIYDRIDHLKLQIVQKAKGAGLSLVREKDSRGHIFKLKDAYASLEIALGPEWIGYDLAIHNPAIGRVVGGSLDTDNYSLEYDLKISEDILQETFECLDAFLNHRLYVGKEGAKIIFALELNSSRIIVTEYMRSGRTPSVLSEEQFTQLRPRLCRVKDLSRAL